MGRIDEIMRDYPELKVELIDMDEAIGGYIYRNHIMLNRNMTERELIPILYEELGHYRTTVGNISNYSCTDDRQQEHRARVWGLTHLITKQTLSRFRNGYDDDYEVADELGINVTYLHEAGKVYKEKPYL